uniref:Uncharacterized protein n=1 Tax=Sus scrofa TaxID=9823 RepID=A0A4X1VS81_PIG
LKRQKKKKKKKERKIPCWLSRLRTGVNLQYKNRKRHLKRTKLGL